MMGCMVERTCEQCGGAFRARSIDVARGRGRFCGGQCRGLARRVVGERPCERCGASFRPTRSNLEAGKGLYCSPRCGYDARRRYERPESVTCAHCGAIVPVKIRGTSGQIPKYCDAAHYWAHVRERARERAQERDQAKAAAARQREIERADARPRCRQCGEKPAVGRAGFCSRACAGRSLIRRQPVACAGCGATVLMKPSQVAKGRRHCSWECRRKAWAATGGRKHGRSQVERSCERCGGAFRVPPSRAGQRFCTRACRFGADGGMRTIACLNCGAPRRVSSGRLRRGNGKYCSRACFGQANVSPVVERRCGRCQTPMRLRPSEIDRRYCSPRCARLSMRKPRMLRCRVCGVSRSLRTWQRQRFCSLSCANRGRKRPRDPILVARNALILDLHAQGVKAPKIREALIADPRCVPGPAGASWRMEPAAIRQVISRGA